MVKNLLELTDEAPKPALLHAAKALQDAAEAAPVANRTSLNIDTIKESIKREINAVQGSSKGPAQNARNEMDDWFELAIKHGYNFDDLKVMKKFASFLLMLVTEGFMDRDTTGTQMGNFQGSWRGGGFK